MSGVGSHWEAIKDALLVEKRRTAELVQTRESDYLPAALEVLETPVSPTVRTTGLVLLLLLIVTILWLVLGRIDVVASAPGKLVPAESVKLVQAAEGGVVREILVRDGQHVVQGQPLVALDPTVSGADLEQARSALATAQLEAARGKAVLAALDGQSFDFRPPAGTSAAVAATQRDLARAELQMMAAGIAGTTADTRIARAARAESAVQAAKLTETLPLLDQQIDAQEELLTKGYASRLKVIEMRRQRLSAARDRDIAIETVRKADAQIASAGSGGARTRADARAQVLSRISKATSEATARLEELTKAEKRSTLQRLTSPSTGTVANLAIHTIGGVVESTKPLMIIVPDGSRLVVEAKLPNRERAFVRVGQPVAVKVEAFPFTRYGTVPGVIVGVGTDAQDDEKLGLIYPVRIHLLKGSVNLDGATTPLSSGMVATADIRTGRRSIFSYLIGPIDEARLSAGRER